MNLAEIETYEAGIYQLEITDPVIGGPDGIDNLQAKQLANRTNWLKAKLDSILSMSFIHTAVAENPGDTDEFGYWDSFSLTLKKVTLANFITVFRTNFDTVYQAINTKLTAISALTTVADKLIYATGANTFSTTTFTAFARTLLDDADAATMRATLGVLDGIGVGQTWQNLTASRGLGVNYINSTGKPIQVSITVRMVASQGVKLLTDGGETAFISGNAASEIYQQVTLAIPNGGNYQLAIFVGSGMIIHGWWELR